MNCCVCSREAAETHEIFPGIHRKKCIEYLLQVDLCRECHLAAHGRGAGTVSPIRLLSQDRIKALFCSILGVEYEVVNLALNTSSTEKLAEIKESIIKYWRHYDKAGNNSNSRAYW